MPFWAQVFAELTKSLPVAAIIMTLGIIPFAVAERIWPVSTPPRLRDYGMNILIGIGEVLLALPFGIAAVAAAAALSSAIGWQPASVPFDKLYAVPLIGPALYGFLIVFVPLFVTEMWVYWAHRLEHRTPFLWAFHSLHHSDPMINYSTWGRNHFLQTAWRVFFSLFTIGLFVDLDMKTAGQAVLYSKLVSTLLSMFYHSAIRVHLPWLDRIVVTPQVHRIHHAVDIEHHDRNFANTFPIFDVVFGTYTKPKYGEFARTGLEDPFLLPRNPVAAQINPVLRALKIK